MLIRAITILSLISLTVSAQEQPRRLVPRLRPKPAPAQPQQPPPQKPAPPAPAPARPAPAPQPSPAPPRQEPQSPVPRLVPRAAPTRPQQPAPTSPAPAPSPAAVPAGQPQAAIPDHADPSGYETKKEKKTEFYAAMFGAALFSPTGSSHQWNTECPVVEENPPVPAWTPGCTASAPLGLAGGVRGGYFFNPLAVELFLMGAADWSQVKFDQPLPLLDTAVSMHVGRVGAGAGVGLRLISEPGMFRVSGATGGGVMMRHVFTSFSSLDGTSASYVAPLLTADVTVILLGFFHVGVLATVEFPRPVVVQPNFSAIVPDPEVVVPFEQELGGITVFQGAQFFLGPSVGLIY